MTGPVAAGQSPDELARRVRAGIPVEFAEVLAVIDAHYDYQPCRFINGLGGAPVLNEAGANQGSCKLFYFARLMGLDESETLALFGEYYRRDVAADPAGATHPNIRRFMRDGWAGIRYDGVPLIAKVNAV